MHDRAALIQSGSALAGVAVLAVAVAGTSRIRQRRARNENGRPKGRPFVVLES
jgi:hypothetical protein